MKIFIALKFLLSIAIVVGLFIFITYIVGKFNDLTIAEQLSAWWQSLIK